MDMQEKIEMARKNIWKAISDYGKHCYSNVVLEDVTDAFVNQLAEDSTPAKQELREMFRKSPAWDESLDALIINGTRTHDPDYHRIWDLGIQILHKPLRTTANYDRIYHALRFFSHKDDDTERGSFIEAINEIAPKAYAPGKKPSRIFKAICEALGVADNTAGSDFQKLYAQFADELSSRKISFKLFVSLNPAHFITMSNPKNDERGGMLTSCHSFNSTEYEYNCGCAGYARDNCTMIAFTAVDPNDPESLNNRKTTRQLFMYRPGNGLLLQSRMYNSAGGTHGAQAESKVYRDLIQREISECENAPNLWKTFKYYDNDRGIRIPTGGGFGGYPDWDYEEFAAMLSIREDHKQDFSAFSVGTYGLCVGCGCEISHRLYCRDCAGDDEDEDNRCCCDDCGGYYDEDDMWTVYDSDGNERSVCYECRCDNYTYCECCDEYVANENTTEIANGSYVCDDCRAAHYHKCEECGEWFNDDDLTKAVDADGNDVYVCESCRDNHYVQCGDCGRYVYEGDAKDAHKNGEEVVICPDCHKKHNYRECEKCGELFHEFDLNDDSLCQTCAEGSKEETKINPETGEIIEEVEVA